MELEEIEDATVLSHTGKNVDYYVSLRRKIEAHRRGSYLRKPCLTCYGFKLTICIFCLCEKCFYSYNDYEHIILKKFYYQTIIDNEWVKFLESKQRFHKFILKGHCCHMTPIDNVELFNSCQDKILITRCRTLKAHSHWKC